MPALNHGDTAHSGYRAEYNPAMNQPDKAHFLERVSREMDEDLGVLDLAAGNRACCRSSPRKAMSPVAGQSRRWAKPMTLVEPEIRPRLRGSHRRAHGAGDDDLKPFPAGAQPGVRFHIWIYRQRPDVKGDRAHARPLRVLRSPPPASR